MNYILIKQAIIFAKMSLKKITARIKIIAKLESIDILQANTEVRHTA